LNAASIVARVQRRIPAYDQSEYLDEVNVAYKECWDYITQLEDSYFTEQVTVTVAQQSDTFDFLYNGNGNLSSAISPRYFQITRIKINQAGDTNWIPALPRNWNDPNVLAYEQNTQQPVQTSPPYMYTLYGKGFVKFANPLGVGVQIQVVYTFDFLPLKILSNGTVVASGGSTTVVGGGTNFTQIVGADYQASLPGIDGDTDVGVELILPSMNLSFRVAKIFSDTQLNTITTLPPIPVNSSYVLASVPDIPIAHHNVIATIATRNFMSTPGNDSRFTTWAALAEKEIGSMKDSIMQREQQEPPRRGRFPYSLARASVGVNR
jgi:hypothetical protein